MAGGTTAGAGGREARYLPVAAPPPTPSSKPVPSTATTRADDHRRLSTAGPDPSLAGSYSWRLRVGRIWALEDPYARRRGPCSSTRGEPRLLRRGPGRGALPPLVLGAGAGAPRRLPAAPRGRAPRAAVPAPHRVGGPAALARPVPPLGRRGGEGAGPVPAARHHHRVAGGGRLRPPRRRLRGQDLRAAGVPLETLGDPRGTAEGFDAAADRWRADLSDADLVEERTDLPGAGWRSGAGRLPDLPHRVGRVRPSLNRTSSTRGLGPVEPRGVLEGAPRRTSRERPPPRPRSLERGPAPTPHGQLRLLPPPRRAGERLHRPPWDEPPRGRKGSGMPFPSAGTSGSPTPASSPRGIRSLRPAAARPHDGGGAHAASDGRPRPRGRPRAPPRSGGWTGR